MADETHSSSRAPSPVGSIHQLFKDTTEEDVSATACCCQKKCHGYRWTVISLLALGMVVIHAQRVNVSVTLLAVYDNIENHVGNEAARNNLPRTSWSASQIGLLHSGFFLGYLITQIPAGIASYQFSSHRTFGVCILVSCVLNNLFPILIEKNIYAAVMIVRILQGMAEGFLWSASFTLVNSWTPRGSISRVSGFVTTGPYVGLIIGFPLSGFITHYAGWQYVYYISGATGVLWSICWLIFAYDKPDNHPKITEHELAIIRQDKTHHYQYSSYKDIPWRSIATSRPFIAMCVCGFAKGWVFNLMLMQEPTYIHVFGLSIAENGIWSALPFIFKVMVSYSSGFIADYLINHLSLCRTRVRKLLNTLGFGIESLCLFSLSFVYGSKAAITLLSIGISIGGLTMSGWQTNHLDLAPQHAGILVALTQTFSNIAGIISPLVAGYFIQESGNLEVVIDKHVKVYDTDIYGWHMIFLVASLIVAICCTVYVIFASGEEQDWATMMEVPKEEQNISMRSDITTTVSYQTIKQSLETDEDQEHHTLAAP